MLLARLLQWACIAVPAVALALLMRDHLVNIPYLDDYMFNPMFEKAANGFLPTFATDETRLTVHDFFLVQMEHRMAFVRGIIMLRHHWWPDNLMPENWFTFLLLLATGLNVGMLLKKTTDAAFHAWWPVMALASAAIFSPVQYQIVLWAMMFQVAVPACALSTVLVVLMSERLPLWAKWLIGVTCALCATLSFAAGILVWLLPLPAIIWGSGLPQDRRRWLFLTLWLLAFVVTMGLYFHDLHNEVQGRFAYKQGEEETVHRDIGAFFSNPLKSFIFIVHLTGAHLARGFQMPLMSLSFWIGLASLLLMAAACFYWLFRFKDLAMRQKLIPWICLGSYSFGAACLVALGRVWATNSGNNAVSPRYTIHAVPLTVALIAMFWIISRDIAKRFPHSTSNIQKLSVAATMAVLALQFSSWLYGMNMMDTWESSRLRMATNTLFFKEPRIRIEGDIAPNRRAARDMDTRGEMNPKMVNSNRLDQFKLSSVSSSATTAKWTSLTVNAPDKILSAEGFACLPGRRRVADGIFFTVKDKAGDWIIFQIGQVQAMPLFLGDVMGRDMQGIHLSGAIMEAEPTSGFSSTIPLDQLPPGQSELAAWAFDFKKNTVYRMPGGFRVDTTQLRCEPID